MILAYFREASRESSSDFAPVTTILPDANISAVVLGSRIRITTAANRYIVSAVFFSERSEAKRLGLSVGLSFVDEKDWTERRLRDWTGLSDAKT